MHSLNFKYVSSSIYLSGTKLKLSMCISVYEIGTLLFIEGREEKDPNQNLGSEHAQELYNRFLTALAAGERDFNVKKIEVM